MTRHEQVAPLPPPPGPPPAFVGDKQQWQERATLLFNKIGQLHASHRNGATRRELEQTIEAFMQAHDEIERLTREEDFLNIAPKMPTLALATSKYFRGCNLTQLAGELWNATGIEVRAVSKARVDGNDEGAIFHVHFEHETAKQRFAAAMDQHGTVTFQTMQLHRRQQQPDHNTVAMQLHGVPETMPSDLALAVVVRQVESEVDATSTGVEKLKLQQQDDSFTIFIPKDTADQLHHVTHVSLHGTHFEGAALQLVHPDTEYCVQCMEVGHRDEDCAWKARNITKEHSPRRQETPPPPSETSTNPQRYRIGNQRQPWRDQGRRERRWATATVFVNTHLNKAPHRIVHWAPLEDGNSTHNAPGQEVKANEPGKEVKSNEPVKEVMTNEPGQEVKTNESGKEVTTNEPKKEVKTGQTKSKKRRRTKSKRKSLGSEKQGKKKKKQKRKQQQQQEKDQEQQHNNKEKRSDANEERDAEKEQQHGKSNDELTGDMRKGQSSKQAYGVDENMKGTGSSEADEQPNREDQMSEDKQEESSKQVNGADENQEKSSGEEDEQPNEEEQMPRDANEQPSNKQARDVNVNKNVNKSKGTEEHNDHEQRPEEAHNKHSSKQASEVDQNEMMGSANDEEYPNDDEPLSANKSKEAANKEAEGADMSNHGASLEEEEEQQATSANSDVNNTEPQGTASTNLDDDATNDSLDLLVIDTTVKQSTPIARRTRSRTEVQPAGSDRGHPPTPHPNQHDVTTNNQQ